LKALVISVGPAGPQNARLADVTYYGTVRWASENYGKKSALLKFRNRPQDVGFGLNELYFVFGDRLVITEDFRQHLKCKPSLGRLLQMCIDQPHILGNKIVIYCAWKPPSTARRVPVTNEDASEQSHSAASAASSGVDSRPIGACATQSASPSGLSSNICSSMGERVWLRHSTLTRRPYSAYSKAAPLVRLTMPALLAA
jgi:hypothetical protein